MAEALFGGLTVAGIKANLEMEFKVDMGSYIETEDTQSMRDLGIMECLMEKVPNISRMDKNIKGRLKKTNSMGTEFFTKTILLYTEFGKIISYLW